MGQFVAIVTRNAVVFVLLAAILGVMFVVELGMVLVHGITISLGLQTLGMESIAMRDAPVIGPHFTVLGGNNVSLPDVLGFFMAVATAILTPLVAHLVFGNTLDVISTVRHLRASGSTERLTDIAWETVGHEFLVGLALAVLLLLVIVFDWHLFHVRGQVDFEDAARNSALLSELPVAVRSTVPDLWRIGAWAYFGLFLGGALAVYALFGKIETTWFRFWSAFDNLWTPAEANRPADASPVRTLYGYDADGQPVFDANRQIAYDAAGNPLSVQQPAAEVNAERSAPAAAEPAIAAETPPAEPAQGSASVSSVRYPVYGASGELLVTLQEARANPRRYHVEPDPIRIWLRDQWDALHREPSAARNPSQAAA